MTKSKPRVQPVTLSPPLLPEDEGPKYHSVSVGPDHLAVVLVLPTCTALALTIALLVVNDIDNVEDDRLRVG